MPGWTRYNEFSGEVETGLYERPFFIRATPPHCLPRPHGTHSEDDVTIVAFRTEAEAKEWIRLHEAEYVGGPNGYRSLHIENWNE